MKLKRSIFQDLTDEDRIMLREAIRKAGQIMRRKEQIERLNQIAGSEIVK